MLHDLVYLVVKLPLLLPLKLQLQPKRAAICENLQVKVLTVRRDMAKNI